MNRLWDLMARKLSGEATDKELDELEELLRKDPALTYTAQLMEDLWRSRQTPDKDEAARAFERHLFRMVEKANSSLEARSSKLAASSPEARSSQLEAPLPSLEACSLKLEAFPEWAPSYKQPRPFEPLRRHLDIFANYLKITGRSLYRQLGFTAINISGLAIGIASAILLLLWIYNEASFDQFHEKKDRIYMVLTRHQGGEGGEADGKIPMAMGPAIRAGYPDLVEEVVRLNWVGAFVFSAGDTHLEATGYLTDTGFFHLFSFPLVKGNPATALYDEHSLVVTESFAKKLFGNRDPMGRKVRVDSNALFHITGVLKDLPSNTGFRFEYLIPWGYSKKIGWDEPSWKKPGCQTYLLLRPGISQAAADASLSQIVGTHDPDLKSMLSFLHPMTKWRLYSDFKDGKIVGGEIDFLRMLGIIAAFILLIACINYMNLSTARSVRRAREVGIRKVVGAGRGSLIGRFLGESIFMSFLAGLVAILLLRLALPWFDKLIDTDLVIPLDNPLFWVLALGFLVFTGLLAGSYPAFYLSSFRPIHVLKGYFKAAHALIAPRKVLVVIQFTFAIAFIICTLIIYRQISFILNRSMGYDQDHLAFVYIKGDIRKNYPMIRDELLKSGIVTSITRTNSPITYLWSSSDSYEWKGKDPSNSPSFMEFRTDRDFTRTMGLQLVAGRDIDIETYPTDSSAVVLNETAVRQMGLTNPIGQQIKNSDGILHVVGVVKDFVTVSPFSPIFPLVIQGPRSWFGTVTFRMNPVGKRSADIAGLTAIFKKYNPDYPFEYYWVDKAYASAFTGQEHFGTLAALFAGLTIFISCLGLFGLAAYMAESRIREVGVRKVLGASVTRITRLLSKDFLVLVLVSFVIASPLAWWCMEKWLQDYPVRVHIDGWVFLLTGILALLIAGATVGFQALRAAKMSPVKNLRAE